MSQHEMFYQNKRECWNNAFLLSAFDNVIEINTFSQKIWISLKAHFPAEKRMLSISLNGCRR